MQKLSFLCQKGRCDVVSVWSQCFHFSTVSVRLQAVCCLVQEIIRPVENPIKKTAHIQILYGNFAPEGSVAKITGKEGLYFSGAFS